MEAGTIIQVLINLLLSIIVALAALAFRTLQRESTLRMDGMRKDITAQTSIVAGLDKTVQDVRIDVATMRAAAVAHEEADHAQFRRLEETGKGHDVRLRALERRRNGG